jgi:hypothetical protein
MNSIERLKQAIFAAHGASAIHLYSVPLRLTLADNERWEGVVEVFMVSRHPAAKTAYAWTQSPRTTEEEVQHFTVLHLPPVDSPKTAVQSALGRAA